MVGAVMGGAPGGLKRLLDNADVSVLLSNPLPTPSSSSSSLASVPQLSFFFLGVRKPSRRGVFVRPAAVSRCRVALGTRLCLTPIEDRRCKQPNSMPLQFLL